MGQRQRKISHTEKSAFAQLPGDIFQFDSRALDRGASFGLVPMQEGWIAGGVVGKLAVARVRSELARENDKTDIGCGHSDCASAQGMKVDRVDPSLPAKSLLRLREDWIKRGLIP